MQSLVDLEELIRGYVNSQRYASSEDYAKLNMQILFLTKGSNVKDMHRRLICIFEHYALYFVGRDKKKDQPFWVEKFRI